MMCSEELVVGKVWVIFFKVNLNVLKIVSLNCILGWCDKVWKVVWSRFIV